jgi:Phage-related protein
MYQYWYILTVTKRPLDVVFFKTEAGNEPAREWLKSLAKEEKLLIGEDIKAAQFVWPLGEPIVKKLEAGIWEIRTNLKNRISRVFVTKSPDRLIILHGFIKKSMKTPKSDLEITRNRLNAARKG